MAKKKNAASASLDTLKENYVDVETLECVALLVETVPAHLRVSGGRRCFCGQTCMFLTDKSGRTFGSESRIMFPASGEFV